MAGELATTRDPNCQAYLQNLCITLKWQPALTTILSRTILFTDLPNTIPEQNFLLTTCIHPYTRTHIYKTAENSPQKNFES
jgi:hypothetical protein